MFDWKIYVTCAHMLEIHVFLILNFNSNRSQTGATGGSSPAEAPPMGACLEPTGAEFLKTMF